MTEKRGIRIFKSPEEQEAYHFSEMLKTTARERLIALFQMQKLTQVFNPGTDNKRRIIIHHGYPK